MQMQRDRMLYSLDWPLSAKKEEERGEKEMEGEREKEREGEREVELELEDFNTQGE